MLASEVTTPPTARQQAVAQMLAAQRAASSNGGGGGFLGGLVDTITSLSPSHMLMNALGVGGLSPSEQLRRVVSGTSTPGEALRSVLDPLGVTGGRSVLGDVGRALGIGGGSQPMGGAELLMLSQAAQNAASQARQAGADDQTMRAMGRDVVEGLATRIGPKVDAINEALGLADTQRTATDEHLRLVEGNAKYRSVVNKLDTILARIPRERVEDQIVRVYFGGGNAR
jgi:hypothetical protein